MAKRTFSANKLTGGLSGCLDDISHNSISDGDIAFVVNSADNTFYSYYYDSSSSDAEDSPNTIQPDSNTGDGRWILSSVSANIPGLTANATELNQLDGIVVGGTSNGDIVNINAVQTLFNKTLNSAILNTPNIVAGVGNFTSLLFNGVNAVTLTGAEALTNKELTAPTINSGDALTATSTEINTVCDGSTAKNNHSHMVASSYSGNGTSTRNISLGFTAKSAILFSPNVSGNPVLMYWSFGMGSTCISITNTGLTGLASSRMYCSSTNMVVYETYGNYGGITYYYSAWS